jgi:hypothetical protein
MVLFNKHYFLQSEADHAVELNADWLWHGEAVFQKGLPDFTRHCR